MRKNIRKHPPKKKEQEAIMNCWTNIQWKLMTDISLSSTRLNGLFMWLRRGTEEERRSSTIQVAQRGKCLPGIWRTAVNYLKLLTDSLCSVVKCKAERKIGVGHIQCRYYPSSDWTDLCRIVLFQMTMWRPGLLIQATKI